MKADHREPTAERQFENRIPRFGTIDEEAAFWETHSLTAFEDELEVVTDVKFIRAEPESHITVPLEQDALHELTKEARNRGVQSSTLAKEWILERLAEAKEGSRSGATSG